MMENELLAARARFDAIYEFCRGDLSQNIYDELIYNENNMRPQEINSLFKVSGLANICQKLADKTPLLENLGEADANKAHGRLLEQFENFFERRNVIAHSLNLAQSSGSDQILTDIEMFKAFAKSLCETLQTLFARKKSAPTSDNDLGRKRSTVVSEGPIVSPSPPASEPHSAAGETASSGRYNARGAEARWQKIWDERGIFATHERRPAARNTTCWRCSPIRRGASIWATSATTPWATWWRGEAGAGFNVLHPMGWDAFGMPAENAAMERKVHPKAWTYANIAAMKKQLKSMGLSLDWSREIATCDPAYYKHQQKMFLDFLARRAGRAREAKVNWDPVDQTVLANEQVIDGRGWRSGALVEQRELTQWFFKITEYSAGAARRARHARPLAGKSPADAEELDRPLRRLAGALRARSGSRRREGESELEVFTTRPDTLFGAKFMAIAPDHPLAAAAAAKNPALAEFIEECRHRGTAQAEIDTAEKLGFDTGIKAVHPFDPNWKLPVYVANFILMDYGTGAIFGCPAHDQRDLDFVNKYGLGNDAGGLSARRQDPRHFVITDTAYDGDGRMINSRFLDGMTIAQAKEEVARRLEQENAGNRPVAQRQVNFRLRDWGISRQRYWGCPIPVIHCEACGVVPVPEQDCR